MTDKEEPPGRFDQENPTRWGVIGSAFELAGFVYGPPIALSIIQKDQSVVYLVGVLTGIEDRHRHPAETPSRSMFWFKDSERLSIEWPDVLSVLAMVSMSAESDEVGEPAE